MRTPGSAQLKPGVVPLHLGKSAWAWDPKSYHGSSWVSDLRVSWPSWSWYHKSLGVYSMGWVKCFCPQVWCLLVVLTKHLHGQVFGLLGINKKQKLGFAEGPGKNPLIMVD